MSNATARPGYQSAIPLPAPVVLENQPQGTAALASDLQAEIANRDAADIAATAALIELEGLRFDGTAGAVIGGGGIPATGGGDCTMIAEITMSSVSDGLGQAIFGSQNSTYSQFGLVVSNTKFWFDKLLGAESAVNRYVESPINTLQIGAQVIAAVKSGSTVTLYWNGKEVAQSTTITASDTAATVNFGSLGASPWWYSASPISRASKWNYALTAAEIAALTRRGLVTLPEQRGGSMTALNTSTVTTAGSGSVSGASSSGFAATSTGVFSVRSAPSSSVTKGKKYLVSFTASAITGPTPIIGLVDPGVANLSATTSVVNGSNAVTIEATATASIGVLDFGQSGAGTFTVSGLSIIPLGTLFEQDSGQRNAGYMVGDTSGNCCHLELPETGVSIIDPADTGFIEYTRTTDGYLIGDRRVIPSTGYLVEVVATGNGTVTLGESAGTPANVCASVTLTSTPKILPILVTQTSTGKLYADLGTATTATFKIRLRAV